MVRDRVVLMILKVIVHMKPCKYSVCKQPVSITFTEDSPQYNNEIMWVGVINDALAYAMTTQW